MFKGIVLCIPRSEAVKQAGRCLSDLGITVTDQPAPDITHLLLPVPSFSSGDEYLAHYLAELPDDVTVFGGNLHSPLLENYRTVDFLQDPYYLADNAAITAECALELAEQKLPDFAGHPVLVLGWGRIGKCLGKLLQHKGADVTVAARKESDLAMIHALGYRPIPIQEVGSITARFDVIFNTVPVMILPQLETKPDCVILELASKPGMLGKGIINARGLPGKMAPVKSGKLIAETFLRLSL